MIIKLKELRMHLINCRILRGLYYLSRNHVFLFILFFSGAISILDLSFNLLRNVPDRLDHLVSLHTIYFVQNKISKITGLASCTSLRSLELGGNKIRVSIIQSLFTNFSKNFF